MSNLDNVLATLDADRQGALDRLFDLLRFPSISTDPAHAPDCAHAAVASNNTNSPIFFMLPPEEDHPASPA